jgi:hypothetical protein
VDLVSIAIGVLVLLFGRQLFWLFVGVMGFVVGFDIASMHLADQSRVVILGIALVAGVVGVVIALLLHRVAFGVAGFLAGGYFLATVAAQLGWVTSTGYEVVFVIGGITGALAAIFLTDWALIVLSSLIGAAIISDALLVEPRLKMVMFFVLAIVGILVQRQAFQRLGPPRMTGHQ